MACDCVNAETTNPITQVIQATPHTRTVLAHLRFSQLRLLSRLERGFWRRRFIHPTAR